MDRIVQGNTVYIVEGNHSKNVYLHQVFVNKIYIKRAKKEIIEQEESSTFGFQAEGLMALVGTNETSSTNTDTKAKDEIFIEDFSANSYNITKNSHRVFKSRKNAKKLYKRLKSIRGSIEYSQLRDCESLDSSIDISKNYDKTLTIGKTLLKPDYVKEEIDSNCYN